MTTDPFDDERTIERLRARREHRDELAGIRKDQGDEHLDYLIGDDASTPLDSGPTMHTTEHAVDGADFLVWQRDHLVDDGETAPTADAIDVKLQDSIVSHYDGFVDASSPYLALATDPTDQPTNEPTTNKIYDASSPYLAATNQTEPPTDQPTTDKIYDASTPYLAATTDQPADETAAKGGTDVAMEDLQLLDVVDPSAPGSTVDGDTPVASPSTTERIVDMSSDPTDTSRLRDALLDDDITRADAMTLPPADGTSLTDLHAGTGDDITSTVEAFEDLPGGGDNDFQDRVVAAQPDDPSDSSSLFRPEIEDEVVVGLVGPEDAIDVGATAWAEDDPTSDPVSRAFDAEELTSDVEDVAPPTLVAEFETSQPDDGDAEG